MNKLYQVDDSSESTSSPAKPDEKLEDWLGEKTLSAPRSKVAYSPMQVGQPTAEQLAALEARINNSSLPVEEEMKNPDPAEVTETWTVRGVSEETRRLSKIAALMTKLPIGEFVDKALFAAVLEDAETLHGRANATPKGKKGKIWTIRGVTPETRKLSRIAALQLGWTVGEFVERALLDATERLQIKSSFP